METGRYPIFKGTNNESFDKLKTERSPDVQAIERNETVNIPRNKDKVVSSGEPDITKKSLSQSENGRKRKILRCNSCPSCVRVNCGSCRFAHILLCKMVFMSYFLR